MKKILTALLAVLMTISVSARDYKNEFSLTYGQATVSEFVYVVGGAFGAIATATVSAMVGNTNASTSFENTMLIGAIGAEYIHYTNDWFGFGGTVVCDYSASDMYTTSGDGEKTYNGKFGVGIVSIMPSAKFSWFNRDKVSLYSKLSCGPGIIFGNGSDSDGNVILSAQVTPIGVDFGNQTLRGFVEAGVGMQGILNVGLRKRF